MPCQCQINPNPTPIAQNNLIPQSNHNYLQPMKIQLLESRSILYVMNNLSLGQFFIMLMIWSKLSSNNLQCLRVVNIPTRMNRCSISIYDPKIPSICLARKLTFGNWVSWICHQAKEGSTHVVGVINLLNKDNFPTTSAHDDSSINAPTPNTLLSFSIESPNLAIYPTTSIANRV